MKPVKKAAVSADAIHSIKARLRRHKLHTVCEEARCPNLGECFSRGTATFMILGDTCTRSCGFCGVKSIQRNSWHMTHDTCHLTPDTWHMAPVTWHVTPCALQPPDPNEPVQIARMAGELGLKHVVITSVTRDDLPDEGASHFARTITQIWGGSPKNEQTGCSFAGVKVCKPAPVLTENRGGTPIIEVLTPDFHARPECLKTVCDAGPDVYNHNVETVRRLTPIIRSNADYDRSLNVLKWVGKNYPNITLKSGIMVGLGEKFEEVVETLRDLWQAGCQMVTVGQYLQPAKERLKVTEYVKPELFEKYKVIGEELGINYVFSGHFVRSSYMAEKQRSKF